MVEAGVGTTSGRKWWKYGCFGCLGLIGVLILVVVGVLAAARLGARSEQVEEKVLTPDLPVASAAPGQAAGEAAESPPAGQPAEQPVPAGAGTVVLDLSGADFHVRPGAPGERLHVEATYDKTSYLLEEDLEPGDHGAWRYTVGFRNTGSGMYAFIKHLMGGTSPKVVVVLPVDVPISLEVRMMRGGLSMDLGGLWLETADLHLTQGGFQLDVSKPLRHPMERLAIIASMGGSQVSHLGNASPRDLDVDFSMGGMFLDLRGRWMADADISLTTSNAGVQVRLPSDVAIEGLSGHERPVDPSREVPEPVLRFTTSSHGGKIEFE